MKRITLTIDGTCLGSPGPGGWAYILRYGEHSLERSGGSTNTTKARMELLATLEAFKAIKEPCEVGFYSDSQQLLDGVLYWRDEWRLTEWTQLRVRLSDPLPDGDLWKALDPLAEKHLFGGMQAQLRSGSPDKKRCEELAVAQAGLYGDAPCWSSIIDEAA
jgi:ribonuclease HI